MPLFAQSAVLALNTTIRLRITIYLDEDQTQPKDLTNASAIVWELRTDRPQEPTARLLVTKSLGSGVSVNGDPTNGQIDVLLSPADQSGLRYINYYHQVDVTDAATDISRPTVGFLSFQA